MLLVVHLSFSHAKQLLMKLLFESLQTYANLGLGLMAANYIPTRCVNPCLPVFLRVGIWTQKRVNSYLDKTRAAALKNGHVLFPTNRTRMWSWKLLYSRQTEENWLLQCWWVLFALQHCVWSHWVSFTTSVPVKSCVPVTEEDMQRGSKKRELDALRRHNIQEKGYKVIEMWDCEWWRLYKSTNTVKQHIREDFPYRRSLTAEQLLEEIREGKLFGYVQCDIELAESLRENFANFPPIFKNTFVSKSDLGDLMKNYAEAERFLSQPQKTLISRFTLQTGTLITPLLLFYLQLGLVCPKVHRFVEYTPKKCFNSFVVQSAVDVRGQGVENPNSSVVAESMKLLANISYGYQIMDRSRRTVKKYLTDEKTDAAINSKLFKKLDLENNSLYEVELAKHRFNTMNHSLSGSSFFNTQNFECWSCTTTSPPKSVM